jgi:hypothetical protein
MALKIVQFFAVILTALALVPAGAHFFELPIRRRDARVVVVACV